MAINTVSVKSVKAYLLAGIFASLIACDFFSAEWPDHFRDGDKTTLVSGTQAINLLRDTGTKSFGNLASAKILALGYPVTPFFQLLKKETLLKSFLLVNSYTWNSFYVHISHQAP